MGVMSTSRLEVEEVVVCRNRDGNRVLCHASRCSPESLAQDGRASAKTGEMNQGRHRRVRSAKRPSYSASCRTILQARDCNRAYPMPSLGSRVLDGSLLLLPRLLRADDRIHLVYC